MKNLTDEQKMELAEVANMSAGELPKDYTENHNNIWRAFNIGKAQTDADLRARLERAETELDALRVVGWKVVNAGNMVAAVNATMELKAELTKLVKP